MLGPTTSSLWLRPSTRTSFDVPDKYMEMYGGTGELDRDYFEIPEYKRVSATDVNKARRTTCSAATRPSSP